MKIKVSAYINEQAFKDEDPVWSFQFNPEDIDDTRRSLKSVEALMANNEYVLLSKVKE